MSVVTKENDKRITLLYTHYVHATCIHLNKMWFTVLNIPVMLEDRGHLHAHTMNINCDKYKKYTKHLIQCEVCVLWFLMCAVRNCLTFALGVMLLSQMLLYLFTYLLALEHKCWNIADYESVIDQKQEKWARGLHRCLDCFVTQGGNNAADFLCHAPLIMIKIILTTMILWLH